MNEETIRQLMKQSAPRPERPLADEWAVQRVPASRSRSRRPAGVGVLVLALLMIATVGAWLTSIDRDHGDHDAVVAGASVPTATPAASDVGKTPGVTQQNEVGDTTVVTQPSDGSIPKSLVLERFDGQAQHSIVSVDLATGETRELDVTLHAGDIDGRFAKVGQYLFVADGGQVRRFPLSSLSSDTSATPVGELIADGTFILGASNDAFWLIDRHFTSDLTPLSRPFVDLVALVDRDGTVLVPARQLEPFGAPLAAVGTQGLLVSGPDGLFEWDPRTGLASNTFGGPGSAAFDVQADTVVWAPVCPTSCPELRVRNTTTGQETVLRPPTGFDGFAGLARLSPDGRYIAAIPVSASGSTLAIIDIANPTAPPVAEPIADRPDVLGWIDNSTTFLVLQDELVRVAAVAPPDVVRVTLPSGFYLDAALAR